jgi:hypothetical protein
MNSTKLASSSITMTIGGTCDIRGNSGARCGGLEHAPRVSLRPRKLTDIYDSPLRLAVPVGANSSSSRSCRASGGIISGKLCAGDPSFAASAARSARGTTSVEVLLSSFFISQRNRVASSALLPP